MAILDIVILCRPYRDANYKMTEAFVQVLWDVYGVSQAGWFSAVTLLPDPSCRGLNNYQYYFGGSLL